MASATYTCKTCNLVFGSAQEWRTHAKDEWHVYRLQLKTAEEGAVVVAPSTPDPKGEFASSKRALRPDSETLEDDEDNSSDYYESEDDEVVRDFVPTSCLFCKVSSPTFELNLDHMRREHGLMIPFQEYLLVDLETIVWYLHISIAGYFECMFCGRRKRTEEAVVQHMLAKGHCRVNLAGEIREYWKDEVLEETNFSARDVLDGERTLRQEKIYSTRLDREPPARRRTQRTRESQAREQPSTSVEHGTTALSRTQEKREASMALTMKNLSRSDQASLSHLAPSEQRAALATRQKQTEKAGREEARARAHVERLGNKTLMKHFVADTPGRKNG